MKGTLQGDMQELRESLMILFTSICKALKLDKIVDWLAKKLNKEL